MTIHLAHLRGFDLPRGLPRTEYARGVVYATGAGVALGTLGPASTIAYGAGMSSPTFAALRATIGALVLAAFLVTTRADRVDLRRLPTRDRMLLGLTSVAQAALSLSIFAAYGAMAVAPVVAVYFCYPLLVAGGSIALRTRATDGQPRTGPGRRARRPRRRRPGRQWRFGPDLGGRPCARRDRRGLPGDVPRRVAIGLHAGRVAAGDGGDPGRSGRAHVARRGAIRALVRASGLLVRVSHRVGRRRSSPESSGPHWPRSGCCVASGGSAARARRS